MSKPQHVTNVASGPEKCAVCGKRVYATVRGLILFGSCFTFSLLGPPTAPCSMAPPVPRILDRSLFLVLYLQIKLI